MTPNEQLCKELYEKHTNMCSWDEFITIELCAFGDMSAKDFVIKLQELGNADSADDAWGSVLGVLRRVYE